MEIILAIGVLVVLLFLFRRTGGRSQAGMDSGGGEDDPDITSYPTREIPRSGLFSANQRRMEYRRRGKSPSGVIDGVYNDMYRENGRPYSDVDRDWDADA